MQRVLRVNQRDAVAYVLDCMLGSRHPDERAAVLALAMGLGKTLITLASVHALLHAPPPHRIRRVLILCPASLVENWSAEISKWLPPGEVTFIVLTSRADMERFVGCAPSVLVCGFEAFVSLRTYFELHGMPCDVLVLDEAHKVTNMATDLYQLVLTVPTSRRLLLSGTPMRNDALHYYYALLNLALPGAFGSANIFKMLFERPLAAMADGGCVEKGRRAMKVLQRKSGCVLSMDESFLRTFLPPLTEVLMLAEPTDLQVASLKLLQNKKALGVNDLEDCRRILTSPSMLVGEWWEERFSDLSMPYLWGADEYLKQSGALRLVMALIKSTMHQTEDKLVVSSYRNEDLAVIRILCCGLNLGNNLAIMGTGRGKGRQRTIDSFNDIHSDNIRILLIPALSGGVGITLTGACRMIVLGAAWDPTNDSQLTRRCWLATWPTETGHHLADSHAWVLRC